MEVHTFRAANLQEALEQVRLSLGPDASILKTRSIKRSRLGLFGKIEVEVEASGDLGSTDPKSPANTLPAQSKSPATVNRLEENLPSPSSMSSSAELRVLEQEVDGKKTEPSSPRVKSPTPAGNQHSGGDILPEVTPPSTPVMFELFSEMMDAGVEPGIAKSMLYQVAQQCEPEQQNDVWLLRGRLCQWIASQLNVAGALEVRPNRREVVAIVGPTGVGKTTTIAKLATSLRLEQNCNVGLITLDTFRAGAVDQLLRHAEALDAPLEVVSASDQFQPALDRLRHCNIVLVDTAGRSPGDIVQIRVLQESLIPAQPTSILLALSATSSAGHIRASLKHFAALSPTGLVITKVDESVGFGAWLSVLRDLSIPVSYVTHGQEVPRDFAIANRRRLASMLLGQGNHHSLTHSEVG